MAEYVVGEKGPELFVPPLAEPERIVREVSFAVEGDGRTIEARIVPYNTDTKVVDLPQHGGTGIPYVERWLPGVFDRQANAANRVEVLLNFEHQRGIANVVGHGIALREESDALYGTFRVHPGPDGDKALHMVNEGILTGLSVEAIPRKSRPAPGGIVERVKATLDNVALCRAGRAAYPLAQVLAVREQPDPDEPEPEPEPAPEPAPAPEPERTSEVDEILKRVGYEPLLVRAVTRKPWDGSASRFEDDEYKRSCLIDRGGEEPVKERCSLPVLEPNGDVNANALGAAAAALAGARGGVRNVSTELRASAARKLIRYYRQAEMDPPESLRAIAAR